MALKEAAGPEFYETVLEDRRNSQWLPLARNPYRTLWIRTALLVPRHRSVVELGCGTGRLGPLLATGARTYLGLDFAPRLIEEARRYAPRLTFEVSDLRTEPIPDAQVYVANEVLEHLAQDLALLRRLPKGATVVLSVPSFDSASHVRFFPARGEAQRRYGSALAIDHVEYVPHGRAGRFFHLMRGTRT